MPLVNYPIECSSCRGLGEVKPGSAFEFNRKLLAIECLNCGGKGSMDNMVYVNPSKESVLKDGSLTQVNTIIPIQPIEELNFKSPSVEEISQLFDEKELDKASKEIKKIKSKKADHHHARR